MADGRSNATERVTHMVGSRLQGRGWASAEWKFIGNAPTVSAMRMGR
jgi:hypothetical protein